MNKISALIKGIPENGNWCSHYGKQYGGASKNEKVLI